MKKKKTYRILILCLLLAFCAAVAGLPAVSAAPTNEVTLSLSENEADAQKNYTLLRQALRAVDGKTPTVITLQPAGGRFCIEITGASPRLQTGTTLDLNGSTLLRWGDSKGLSLLQNADADGEKTTAGGYALTKGIAVKNGVLDGNAALSDKGDLLHFGHADGITLTDLKIRNAVDGHLLELCGCRNCVIKNCEFSGRDVSKEALQLDIAYAAWNSTYVTDNTPCRNVTVEGCTFLDAPAGVGNHHALTGKERNENIKILNCRFLNSVKYDEPLPAIWCYGATGCVIEGNTVNGLYATGVRLCGGSAEIRNNTIDLKNAPDTVGISLKAAYCTDPAGADPDARVTEAVTQGLIAGNRISHFTENGVHVSAGARIGGIENNTVADGSGTGILVTKATVAGGVSGNTVTGCAAVSADNPGHGIHVTGTGYAAAVEGNTVKRCSGWGITCVKAAATLRVSGNRCEGNGSGSTRITYKAAEMTPFVFDQGCYCIAAAPVKAAAILEATGGLKLTGDTGEVPQGAPAATGMLLKMEGFDYTLVLKGDVNGDGLVTTADARLALRCAIRLDDPSKPQRLSAAIHDRDTVTTKDARAILRAAIGLERIHIDFN